MDTEENVCACACGGLQVCRRVQGCVGVHTCVQAWAGACRLRVTVENGSPGSVPESGNCLVTSETGAAWSINLLGRSALESGVCYLCSGSFLFGSH